MTTLARTPGDPPQTDDLAMTSETATYVYCLVRAGTQAPAARAGRTTARARPPSLARVPAGLPGCGRPRLLDAGARLWLVVADAPLALYGEAPIERGLRDLAWVSERAVAHEAVVSSFLAAEALLPLKLFTLFSTDERALAFVKKERRRLERILDRVAGCVEWGVRLSLDEASAVARATAEAEARAGAPTSGAAYLLRKKAVRDTVRDLAGTAQARADEVFDALAERARDARRRPPLSTAGPTRVVLDATFLVERAAAARWKAAVRAQARALAAEGYALELTGPWPPYHFGEGRG